MSRLKSALMAYLGNRVKYRKSTRRIFFSYDNKQVATVSTKSERVMSKGRSIRRGITPNQRVFVSTSPISLRKNWCVFPILIEKLLSFSHVVRIFTEKWVSPWNSTGSVSRMKSFHPKSWTRCFQEKRGGRVLWNTRYIAWLDSYMHHTMLHIWIYTCCTVRSTQILHMCGEHLHAYMHTYTSFSREFFSRAGTKDNLYVKEH